MIFHSLQCIPHLSCKYCHFGKKIIWNILSTRLKNIFFVRFALFKSGQIFRNDAHCSENNFSVHELFLCDFYFLRYGRFCRSRTPTPTKYVSSKSTISQKLKVTQKKLKNLKNRCQSNSHVSCKFCHFSLTMAHLVCHRKLQIQSAITQK